MIYCDNKFQYRPALIASYMYEILKLMANSDMRDKSINFNERQR